MARVVVAMSGGVDSSVAAVLLQREGHEVLGATMLVWAPPGSETTDATGCCGLAAAEDARRVCARLGIRHYTLDYRERFYREIVRDYVDEYARGRTPNPCVRCNTLLKFGTLLEHARALGAEYLATGHYARVRYHPGRKRWLLLRGAEEARDQSYALYGLTQAQLAAVRFPLGELRKAEVRALAAQLELPTAGKPDSQETCFVPDNDYPALIQLLAPEALRPGEVRSPEGALLGRHPGVPHYTYGQRRRLNVGSPRPLYVAGLDAERAVVTAAPAGHPALHRHEVTATRVNLVAWEEEEAVRLSPMPALARVRYNSAPQEGTLQVFPGTAENGPRLQMDFAAPVRAPAPGQSLVCYGGQEGDELLAGGIIEGYQAASRG